MMRELLMGRRRWVVMLLGAIALVASGLTFMFLSAPQPLFADPASVPGLEQGGSAERGHLLFTAGDCAA